MSNKIILSDRMLIPKELIPLKAIKQRYLIELFNDKMCDKCENKEFRSASNELCKSCEGLEGSYKLFKELEQHWSVPQGDELSLTKLLDKKNIDYIIKDKRPEHQQKFPIKFTGKLFGEGYVDENGISRINQKKLVKEWLKYKNGILKAKPRSGKCLVGSTIVNTKKGFVHFNELNFKKGYHVYDNSIDTPLGPRKVTHAFKDKSKTIKLVTHNGFEIEGTPEHPVLVFTPNLKFTWRELRDIKLDDHIVSLSDKNSAMWSSTDQISVDDAKILGWMTANGRNTSLSTGDSAVVKEFNRIITKVYNKKIRIEHTKSVPTLYVVGNFKTHLANMGYIASSSREKDIPFSVRSSSKNIMRVFLNAYFQCDSGANNNSIELVSASKKLIYQLHVILHQGFNILATKSVAFKSATNSNKPIERPYYVLHITGIDAYNFCKEFPNAKVAKNFSDRFTARNTPSSQEFSKDYIPYITGYLRNLYKARKVSSNPKDTRIYLEDGTSVFNYGSPYNLRLFSTGRSDNLTRKTFIETNWSIWVDKLTKIDSSLRKPLEKLLKYNFKFERVVHIKKSVKTKVVYDVTVPKTHAFTANCITSHNTVMSVFLACYMKQRVIILADRFELLNQFYRTFMGYKRKRLPPRTNIPELRKKYGKEIIRLAKKPKDLTNLKNVDILLLNYQKLVRDPKRMLKLIDSGKYSFLIVDEVHGSGADGYLKVVSQASVKHRLSLTATDRRKDNRHRLIYRIMGPVVAKSGSASLIPEIRIRQSKAFPTDRKGKPINYKQWHHAMSWLCSNKALQVELLQALFHDLRNGHTHIIVPLDRKKHIDMLVKMVNQQAATNNKQRGENWPKDLAIKFYDGVDRQDVLDKVDRKKPVILFGMRSMIKQGIDFQLPSKIHVFIPMSASNDRETGAPMLEQLGNRVATPANKPSPVIDIWFHNVKFFFNCNSGLFWNEAWPNRVTTQNKNGKYRIADDTYQKMRNMQKSPSTQKKDNFGWV